jgi:hypothetical protein
MFDLTTCLLNSYFMRRTTKLSKLQKGILKAALSMHWHRAYDGKKGFLSSEAIGEIFFGIPRLSMFRNKSRQRQAEYLQKRKIHNRIDASISRTLSKLQDRGLVDRAKIGFYAGCRLTKHGLETAKSLVPASLTGPSKQEESKMKARGVQAEESRKRNEALVLRALRALR